MLTLAPLPLMLGSDTNGRGRLNSPVKRLTLLDNEPVTLLPAEKIEPFGATDGSFVLAGVPVFWA